MKKLILSFIFVAVTFVASARTVTIAASNSLESEKAAADVVCTGTHDELTIQRVLDQFDKNSSETVKILFYDGQYNIDGFHVHPDATHRTAIKIPEIAYLEFGGLGNLRARTGISVNFAVREGAYEGLDPEEQVCVTPDTKTMYDPCPAGYHVPNYCDIVRIKASGAHSFEKTGARWYDLTPDAPDKVGEYGYYWCATTDVHYLNRAGDYYIWNVGFGLAMGSHYFNSTAFCIRPQKF